VAEVLEAKVDNCFVVISLIRLLTYSLSALVNRLMA